MTMHGALHPRDDMNWLYVSRKVGRGRDSIEDCVDVSIRAPKDYIKKSQESLISVASKSIGQRRPNRKTRKQNEKQNKNKNKTVA